MSADTNTASSAKSMPMDVVDDDDQQQATQQQEQQEEEEHHPTCPPPLPPPPPPMQPPMIGPPRPDAIATFLTTDDFLPGVQTLLYSVKEKLSPHTKDEYPNEIIVLATPSVSQEVRRALHPAFCTRIIDVEPIPFPKGKNRANDEANNGKSHVSTWDANCGLTKLNVFALDNYGTILYLDADCLVVKDVRHLLRLGHRSSSKSSSDNRKRKGLIAAAPDIFPPDKFNAGVMVLRPSRSVLDDMIAKANSSPQFASYDGGDTGFLNAYYPHWFTTMDPSARLPFGCNAQRFMHACTYEKQPKYWDVGIEKDDLCVVHYSSSPKPWENKGPRGRGAGEGSGNGAKGANDANVAVDSKGAGDDAGGAADGGGDAVAASLAVRDHLTDTDAKALSDSVVAPTSKLDVLWHDWHQRSVDYAARLQKKSESRRKRQAKLAAEQAENEKPAVSKPRVPQKKQQNAAPTTAADMHKAVGRRYKELRKTGMSAKVAMSEARAECGADRLDGVDAGTQVMNMFGMA